jgi:hypothetical protein
MQKISLSFAGVCIIVFLLLGTVPMGKGLPSNGVLQVPYSSDVPIIDGQWSTPSEWNSSSEYRFTQGDLAQLVAFFRLENNGTHLFILVDFISDTSYSGYDGLAVLFDTKDDGGNAPSQDDYRVYCENGRVSVAQGTGQPSQPGQDSWLRLKTQPELNYSSGFSHTNDPYDNQRDHETYELAIPLSFLTTNKNMGFWAEVSDGKTSAYVSWPVHISKVPYNGGILMVSPPLPRDWGDIAIKSVPTTTPTPTPSIPEFPSTIILVFLITAMFALAFEFIGKMLRINRGESK